MNTPTPTPTLADADALFAALAAVAPYASTDKSRSCWVRKLTPQARRAVGAFMSTLPNLAAQR